MHRARRIVGDRLPRRITDSDPLDVHYRLKIKGREKCEMAGRRRLPPVVASLTVLMPGVTSMMSGTPAAAGRTPPVAGWSAAVSRP